jgi:hypothetical protein
MAIGSATNCRSMIATVLWRVPCGNSVPVLRCRDGGEFALCAVLNSFVYDWALRARLGGVNLNRFALAETPLPDPARLLGVPGLRLLVASLCWPAPEFSDAWQELGDEPPKDVPLERLWATDPRERRRRRALLEAIVAEAYDLERADLEHVLRDTHHPPEALALRSFTRGLDPKGFWRVDKDLPPHERLTTWCRTRFRQEAGNFARRMAGAVGSRGELPGFLTETSATPFSASSEKR